MKTKTAKKPRKGAVVDASTLPARQYASTKTTLTSLIRALEPGKALNTGQPLRRNGNNNFIPSSTACNISRNEFGGKRKYSQRTVDGIIWIIRKK